MGIASFDPQRDIADLSGKVVLITGGTAGLGKKSAITLAQRNVSQIYFTGRNEKAAQALIDEVKAVSAKVKVTFVSCDFQSLQSVAEAAQQVRSDRLDILMCNSGIMAVPPGLTKDGFEIQFGVNHLAHAMLIRELMPKLLSASTKDEPARIVILTSLGMKMPPTGGILFDDLKTTQDYGFFSSWSRYGQSKLANVLYAAELANRYPSILSVSVHPGTVATGLVSGLDYVKKAFVYVANLGNVVDVSEGVYNQCWAAGVDSSQVENGAFYEPVGKIGSGTKYSEDKELRERLWNWTQDTLKEVRLEKCAAV